MRWRAAERRKILSLGREPQVREKGEIRKAAKRRQKKDVDHCGSRRSTNLSPPLGAPQCKWVVPKPGAHAPGYEYVAPAELLITSFHSVWRVSLVLEIDDSSVTSSVSPEESWVGR